MRLFACSTLAANQVEFLLVRRRHAAVLSFRFFGHLRTCQSAVALRQNVSGGRGGGGDRLDACFRRRIAQQLCLKLLWLGVLLGCLSTRRLHERLFIELSLVRARGSAAGGCIFKDWANCLCALRFSCCPAPFTLHTYTHGHTHGTVRTRVHAAVMYAFFSVFCGGFWVYHDFIKKKKQIVRKYATEVRCGSSKALRARAG